MKWVLHTIAYHRLQSPRLQGDKINTPGVKFVLDRVKTTTTNFAPFHVLHHNLANSKEGYEQNQVQKNVLVLESKKFAIGEKPFFILLVQGKEE